MELAPNKDDHAEEFYSDRISYRPVSIQNPDATHIDSRSDTMYRTSVTSSDLRNESVSMKLLSPSSSMATAAPALDPENQNNPLMPGPGMGGVHDMPTRFRQSTVSFRTEPYRDSAVL